MPKRKGDFPNNYQAYSDQPPEFFNDHSFEDFYEWKVMNWLIPSQVSTIIRSTHTKTRKVTEYVYKTNYGSDRRIEKLLIKGDSEITVCSADYIHTLTPRPIKWLK